MNFSMNITPFKRSHKHALELEEFKPSCGFEAFIKDFTKFIGGEFIDWWEGIERGIGHITFENDLIVVYWTDFPFSLSFDYLDKSQAIRLRELANQYFEMRLGWVIPPANSGIQK